MTKIEKQCCGYNLRIITFILLWITMVLNGYGTIVFIYLLGADFNPWLPYYDASYLVICIPGIIFSAIGLYGMLKKKGKSLLGSYKCLLYCYIVYMAFNTVIIIIYITWQQFVLKPEEKLRLKYTWGGLLIHGFLEALMCSLILVGRYRLICEENSLKNHTADPAWEWDDLSLGDEAYELSREPPLGDEANKLSPEPPLGDEANKLSPEPPLGDEANKLSSELLLGDEANKLSPKPSLGDEANELSLKPLLGDETFELSPEPL